MDGRFSKKQQATCNYDGYRIYLSYDACRTLGFNSMLMQKKPTDSELETLQLLCQHGSCSVRDVHTALSERRPVVYTTTLKTMQIMSTITRHASTAPW